MRRLVIISIAAVIGLLSASCERKILLQPGHKHGSEIRITLDLEAEMDAECGDNPTMYNDILATAGSVTVIAYPKSETAKYVVQKITGTSGSIWLFPGVYDLMVYTSDFYELDGVYYRGTDKLETTEAYTTSVKAVSKDVTDSKSKAAYIMEYPDPLFRGVCKNFEVVKNVTHDLKVQVDPLSYKYWFHVDVEGLDYITSATLQIDGMYTTVFMANGEHRDDEYGKQSVETTIHKEENMVKGEFFSFGPHQDSDVKNSMLLTFVNGRTINIQLDDISADIKKLTKGGEIIIEQKIVINVGDDGSGFVPKVEDWEEEEVVIPI